MVDLCLTPFQCQKISGSKRGDLFLAHIRNLYPGTERMLFLLVDAGVATLAFPPQLSVQFCPFKLTTPAYNVGRGMSVLWLFFFLPN